MSPEARIRDDEAQRTLERKALRNVRGLVDKLEQEQRSESRTTVRFVAGAVAIALVAALAVYFGMTSTQKREQVIVAPPKGATAAPTR
jgi:hypothetical protein